MIVFSLLSSNLSFFAINYKEKYFDNKENIRENENRLICAQIYVGFLLPG
jgi:hypothetical protein